MLAYADRAVLIYERTLPALPPSVGRIRRELDARLAAAGVAASRRDDIALVVSEAATNVVLHAYVDRAPGPLHVRGWSNPRALRIAIADSGSGLRPRGDSPGAGFGIGLMRRLADALEYETAERGGTRLVATFREHGLR